MEEKERQNQQTLLIILLTIWHYVPLSLRHGSNHIVRNQTFVSPAGPTGQPAVWAEQRGRNVESVLEVDNSPLSLTDDGDVIIPMLVFHLIKKKDYDDVWAVTAVRYLPAFTPMAVDRRSDAVSLYFLPIF